MKKIKNYWERYIEPTFVILFFPLSIIYLFYNTIKYYKQRNNIKKALQSSQKLVDDLDEAMFEFMYVKLLVFNFNTYALESTQIISDDSVGFFMHDSVAKRTIMANLNNLLSVNDSAKILKLNTTLKIEQPNDRIIFIGLLPTWWNSFRKSFKDFLISFFVNIFIVIIVLIYFKFQTL